MSKELNVIARIHSDFPSKFGIPRQSGLIDSLQAKVVFEPEYRNPDALRGLEEFSHIWLIWEFSKAIREDWSPTVRPPRLGGNIRMGVFSTRSPFRPNPIGLSSVRLEQINLHTPDGPVLLVSGADLMDKTPIYDIKPHLPYADCHPDASGGFAGTAASPSLEVQCSDALLALVSADRQSALLDVLAHDPRPRYHDDPDRVYSFEFARWRIRFSVRKSILYVQDIAPL